MAEQHLYFIAIIPPEPVNSEIVLFKKDLAERFHSVAALKVMPHVTLKSPFRLDAGEHKKLLAWFRMFAIPVPAFNIGLRDFGCFPNKKSPVIFVQPVLCKELQQLQAVLLLQFVKMFPDLGVAQLELNYKPHMTVAYRDLSLPMFREAWEEYKDKHYRAVFAAEKIDLLRQNGGQWEVIESCLLL